MTPSHETRRVILPCPLIAQKSCRRFPRCCCHGLRLVLSDEWAEQKCDKLINDVWVGNNIELPATGSRSTRGMPSERRGKRQADHTAAPDCKECTQVPPLLPRTASRGRYSVTKCKSSLDCTGIGLTAYLRPILRLALKSIEKENKIVSRELTWLFKKHRP